MATLLPSAMLGIEVLVRAAPGLPPTTLFRQFEPVDRQRVQKYIDAGVTSAFINADDQVHYQEYLHSYWDSILDDYATPLPSRLRIMSEIVRGVVSRELQSGDTEQLVTSSTNLAHTAVKLISCNDIVLSQLYDVLHHDYGTFTHSANVSFYSILLAKRLGYTLEEQQEIAVGAMLHDLGKLEIDSNIINKPGTLTAHEMQVVRRHPTLGFKRLANRDDVTFGQLMIAYQHHERMDGKGYPCGIPKDEIHPYARICAVVDVFEAYTSERPYRLPVNNQLAAKIIAEKSGTHFDPVAAAIWVEMVQQGET